MAGVAGVDSIPQILMTLASTLRVEVARPREAVLGERVVARVVPVLPKELNIVDDTLTGVFEITHTGLDATLGPAETITAKKDIQWIHSTPEPSLAITDLDEDRIFPPPTNLDGTLLGVPGLLEQIQELAQAVTGGLGQLSATIPMPVKLPVSVRVIWSAARQAEGPALTPGTDYLAPDGLENTAATFFLPPAIIEARTESGRVVEKWWLRATATLSAGTTVVGPVVLPPVEVEVSALPLPTVLALFRRARYRADGEEGALLLVVPSDSPVRSLTLLKRLLDWVQQTTSLFELNPGWRDFVVPFRELLNALALNPPVCFVAEDSVLDFAQINFGNGKTAEDHTESAIFLSASPRTVRLFLDSEFTGPSCDLRIGPGHVSRVPALSQTAGAPAGPSDASDPPGALVINSSPGDTSFVYSSSLQFVT